MVFMKRVKDVIKPEAGEEIASRCIVVILGGKKPCVVLDTSTFALASGVAVPKPTLFVFAFA